MTEADAIASFPAPPPVPTLWVKELLRLPEQGPEDRLSLKPGVNVLVGAPNTGKSRWMRMLDFVMGDDKRPDEAFGEDIASKYEAVVATLVVDGEEWVVERRWGQDSQPTKVTVNGEAMGRDSYLLKLMTRLRMPLVHYPQGNPYGTRSWPELGWRSLFRHMYRRQQFWSDLVDKQPESEQHAGILLFVGIAEVLFSDKYGRLVELEKKVQQLESQREHFVAMLQEVSRELIDEKELGIALTPDSIASAVGRHEAEIETAEARRREALGTLMKSADSPEQESRDGSAGLVESLGGELAERRVNEEHQALAIHRTSDRISELATHRALLADELARMERAADAGQLLADLKVTHCPACDRAIQPSTGDANCYVCHRPQSNQLAAETAGKRLTFEVEQLRSEMREIDDLLRVLRQESIRLQTDFQRNRERVQKIEGDLRPVQIAAAAIVPPELMMIDQDVGRIRERIAQLRRVEATLKKREAITGEVAEIQKSIVLLQSELDQANTAISFDTASDLLTDGMNTYLNAVEALKPKSWTIQQEIGFILKDRTFAVRIGQRSWHSKLGGTLTLLFLLSYHYALMRLTSKPGCHYPGLCILDFPPQLDGVKVSDTENFVLEPFVQLSGRPAQPAMQLIAAGSSFDGLVGANRITFTKVWA